MRFAPLALAALLIPAAHAQAVLVPGAPELAAPPPQSFAFEVRIDGETPRVIGTFAQTETRAGDRLVIVSDIAVPMARQIHTDSLVTAWPGLAPVSRTVHAEDEVERMAFADGRLSGRLVLGNLDEPIAAALPAGVFARGIAARLARSLPFADGYTATFHVVDLHGDVSEGRLSVAAPETLARTGAADATVWPVEVHEPGASAMTYLIEAATRDILGIRLAPQPGMTITIGPPLAAE